MFQAWLDVSPTWLNMFLAWLEMFPCKKSQNSTNPVHRGRSDKIRGKKENLWQLLHIQEFFVLQWVSQFFNKNMLDTIDACNKNNFVYLLPFWVAIFLLSKGIVSFDNEVPCLLIFLCKILNFFCQNREIFHFSKILNIDHFAKSWIEEKTTCKNLQDIQVITPPALLGFVLVLT